MRKILSSCAGALLAVAYMSISLAQPAPGPGPVPDPWIVNGATISYNNGGATLPSTVAGGSKGVGTFNVSGGYYIAGVNLFDRANTWSALQTFSLVPTFPTQASGRFFAGPATGSPTAPSFRAIVASDLPGSFAGFGNPTAQCGPTAIDGSATTAMRSDAACAINLAANYNWSGVHTFAAGIAVTGFLTNGLGVDSVYPIRVQAGRQLYLYDSGTTNNFALNYATAGLCGSYNGGSCLFTVSSGGAFTVPGTLYSGAASATSFNVTWSYGWNGTPFQALSGVGGVGVYGASRTGDSASAGAAAIGVFGISFQNNASVDKYGWGGYYDCYRYPTAIGGCTGTEVDVTNFGSTVTLGSYKPYQTGATHVLWLASGGNCTVANPCYNPATGMNDLVATDASVGFGLVANSTAVKIGWLVGYNALVGMDGNTGTGTAAQWPKGAGLDWVFCSNTTSYPTNCGNGTLGARIESVVSSTTNATKIVFDDTGLLVQDLTGAATAFSVVNATASTVNGIAVVPGASGSAVQLAARGADTSIGIVYNAKGSPAFPAHYFNGGVQVGGQILQVGYAGLGSNAQFKMYGTTSGNVTQTVQSVAGTPFVTWGTGSGTPAVTASAPLAIDSTTGNITCAGCLTNTPAALTKVDDANVTLTLGGTPATALLQAVSITAGWTGTLAVSRGGIGVGTLASNGVLYGNGTSAVQALAVNASSTPAFLSQASSGAPAWVSSTGTGNVVLAASPTITGTLAVSNVSMNGTTFTAGSSTAFFPQFTMYNSTSDANAGYYIVQKSRGGASVNVGDTLGTFLFKGYDSNNAAQNSAFLDAKADAVGSGYVTARIEMGLNGVTPVSIASTAPSAPALNNSVVTVPFTTTSSSTSSGALVVAGGIATADKLTAPTATLTTLAADTGNTDNTVCVDSSSGVLYKGSGTLGVCLGTSSARYKRGIRDIHTGLDQVIALRPKSFFYRSGYGDGGARRQVGFLAEDVVSVTPDLVGLDSDGRPNSVDVLGFVPIIVRAIQQMKAANDDAISALDQRLTVVEKRARVR